MRTFKVWMLMGGLSVAVAGTGLTGCAWSKSKTAKETGRTTAQVATDESISSRVQSELKTAPVYKFPEVQVKTFNGVVALSGFVQTDAQKHAAEQIAQDVPGVQKVENQISIASQVAPTGRTEQGQMHQPKPAPEINGHASQQNQSQNQQEQNQQEQNQQQQQPQQQNQQQ